MLGKLSTEQFRIVTKIDGKIIGDQLIHDPFIHNSTVIGLSRWDLLHAFFKRRFEIRVQVNLHGSAGAERAIMRLNPVDLRKDTDEILAQRQSRREEYQAMGLVTEGATP